MCTAISYNNYFGRNLDLEYSYNEQVVITPKNYRFNFTDNRILDKGYAIIGVAIGRPKFVTADMVSEGTVVIDVGVNRNPDTGKLCGDVDFAAVEPKASVITPVPGGVGPMTICCLMENTIECFLRKMSR